MTILSALTENITMGIIGAVIGAIFGASGLLFFPLRHYMEQKFQKAEKEANERLDYQKQIAVLKSEEHSSISRYLFWIKEMLVYFLNNKECPDNTSEYWKEHLTECAEELKAIQIKRKEIEREQLVEINFEKE